MVAPPDEPNRVGKEERGTQLQGQQGQQPHTEHQHKDQRAFATGRATPAGACERGPPTRKPLPPQGSERIDLLGRRRRFFTRAECALHNQRHDCWLIAHGKVYDVTSFIPKHPAGEAAILRKAGTDTSIDFDFHSSRAQKMWAPFMLGYAEPKPGEQHSDCTIS